MERPGDERSRNGNAGCSKFGSGCDHSGWSDRLQWSGDRRQGSATAVGTGAGGGDVTFGSTLTLSSGGNDDLTITAGTGAVTPTGAVALNDNDLTVASSQNSVITAGISGSHREPWISPTAEPQTSMATWR